MEDALHGDHFTGISYVLGFCMGFVGWQDLQEWADSALFSNQPLFPLWEIM